MLGPVEEWVCKLKHSCLEVKEVVNNLRSMVEGMTIAGHSKEDNKVNYRQKLVK